MTTQAAAVMQRGQMPTVLAGKGALEVWEA